MTPEIPSDRASRHCTHLRKEVRSDIAESRYLFRLFSQSSGRFYPFQATNALDFPCDFRVCGTRETGHDLPMLISRGHRRLWDTYRFPGFRPEPIVVGIFGDPLARVIRLRRRGKKRAADCVVEPNTAGTTGRSAGSAICPAGTRGSTWNWKSAASIAGVAAR